MANYDVLITYDIQKREDAVHSFVKACMEKKGFFDSFIFTNENNVKRIINLPNTTLWKSNTTAKQSREDIQDCLLQYEKESKKKHILEKCISIEFSQAWYANARDATAEEIKKYPEKK